MKAHEASSEPNEDGRRIFGLREAETDDVKDPYRPCRRGNFLEMPVTPEKQKEYWNNRTLRRLKLIWRKHRRSLEVGTFRRLRRVFRKHGDAATRLFVEQLSADITPTQLSYPPLGFFDAHALVTEIDEIMGREYDQAIGSALRDIVWHVTRMAQRNEEWEGLDLQERFNYEYRHRLAAEFAQERRPFLENTALDMATTWADTVVAVIAGLGVVTERDKVLGTIRSKHSVDIKNKARLVASTEIQQALGWARNRAYHEEEFFEEYHWSSVVDALTRHTHARNNGMTVRKGERFPNGLRYPGDPTGSIKEIAHCRCDYWAGPAQRSDDQ